jgi:hypothetical protein
MGMTYEELSVYGRLRKIFRCGPVSMFQVHLIFLHHVLLTSLTFPLFFILYFSSYNGWRVSENTWWHIGSDVHLSSNLDELVSASFQQVLPSWWCQVWLDTHPIQYVDQIGHCSNSRSDRPLWFEFNNTGWFAVSIEACNWRMKTVHFVVQS